MNEGWMKNDEGWRMKDEGWWFQAGFWLQTDRITDICECRVAFATEVGLFVLLSILQQKLKFFNSIVFIFKQVLTNLGKTSRKGLDV